MQGGNDGPYYNPQTRTIILNHPFSALVLNVFQKEYPKITPHRLGELFAELEYFVLFHEVGHALVDQWDLPVLGREEDAVDAFSTIFMTEFVNEGEFALAGADFFYYLAGTQQARRGRLRRRALVRQAARVLDRLLGLREQPDAVRLPADGAAGRAPRALRRRVPEAEEGLVQLPRAPHLRA